MIKIGSFLEEYYKKHIVDKNYKIPVCRVCGEEICKELYTEISGEKTRVFSQIKLMSKRQKSPTKKIIEYIHKIVIIDNKIKEKSEQLNFLEQKLGEMEKLFKKSVGINHKIFTMRYIDGLKAGQISRRVGYSVRSVYRVLETGNHK